MNTSSGITCPIKRYVYFSTSQRSLTDYPKDTQFTLELPNTITEVHGIGIRHFMYCPEYLINANTQTMSIQYTSPAGTATATITIPTGDYGYDINSLLCTINKKISAYFVEFTIDPATNLVSLVFTGSYVTNYFAIQQSKLLAILGFTNGIALYRTTPSGAGVSKTTPYVSVAPATNFPNMNHDSSLVMKITDLEVISSIDGVTNRATAVLLSSRNKDMVVEQSHNHMHPLLQVQSRVQRLRVQFMNLDGEPYDFGGQNACFTLEFHCDNCRKS